MQIDRRTDGRTGKMCNAANVTVVVVCGLN